MTGGDAALAVECLKRVTQRLAGGFGTGSKALAGLYHRKASACAVALVDIIQEAMQQSGALDGAADDDETTLEGVTVEDLDAARHAIQTAALPVGSFRKTRLAALPGVDDKPPETVLTVFGLVQVVELATGFIKPLEDFDLDVEDLDDDEYDYDADLQEEARALREKMREMRSLRYAWFVLRKEKVALILAKAARKIPNWKPPNRCERVVVALPPPPPKSAVQKRIEARARQLLGL